MSVLIERPCEDTDTDTDTLGRRLVTPGAEMGVMKLCDKGHQGLPATPRSCEEARKPPSLDPSEETRPQGHLDFWTSGF